MSAVVDGTPPRDTLPPAVAKAGQQAGRLWASRTLRERQAIAVGAVALLALVIWLVLVQPALRTLRDAPLELDRLDAQLQQMQLAAGEAQALRGTPPVSTEQVAAALRAASERLGPGARLAIQGERATVTMTNVGTEALRAWLTEVRSGARARPLEAQLVKAANGYSGTITLVLGGGS